MGELLPLVFTSGWASGVNAYATVLVLGLLGRFAGLEQVPAGLERTDVLVVAAVLYVLEFVTDKIPYVDSLWDSVHTVIRPAVGTVIALLVSGDASTLHQADRRRRAFGPVCERLLGQLQRQPPCSQLDRRSRVASVISVHGAIIDPKRRRSAG